MIYKGLPQEVFNLCPHACCENALDNERGNFILAAIIGRAFINEGCHVVRRGKERVNKGAIQRSLMGVL